MANSLSWFKFLAGDWVSDAQVLLMASLQRGWYINLLAFCWTERGLPNIEWKLRKLAGAQEDFDEARDDEAYQKLGEQWAEVMSYFSVTTPNGKIWNGKLYCLFLDSKMSQEKLSEAGRKGGLSKKARPQAKPEKARSLALALMKPGLSEAQAYASDSDSGSSSISDSTERESEGKPNIDFDETEVGFWKERLYARHPKKRDLVLVEHECARLWAQKNAGAIDFFREIDRVHGLWCTSEGWTKENGRYAPKLAEWLGDRGWTKEPEIEKGFMDD